MKYNYMCALIGTCLLAWLALATGCKKLVDVSPPITAINDADVYTNDASAIAVMTGVYASMAQSGITGSGLLSLSLLCGLSSDELTLVQGSTNTVYVGYYSNALNNSTGSDPWSALYPIIYITNSAIQGVSGSSTLTPAVKVQLLGEAKFMRALCYFYLVNLYGDVPLVLSPNYTISANLARTPQTQVWLQIVSDLKSADSLLSSTYLDATLLTSTAERLRPTKGAAAALLARAYLYTQDWPDAEAQATSVISNSATYSLNSLDSVFLAGSTEAIWQLQPVNSGQNTLDATFFILPAVGPDPVSFPIYLDTLLVNAFETNDGRRSNWIDSVSVNGINYYYPYKYKVNTYGAPVTEYEMVLRLGEQYLIRSEARIQQGNAVGAVQDINVIRERAGLPDYAGSTDETSLLAANLQERRVELFTELGNRWLDLKRTGEANNVMSIVTPLKDGTWNIDWELYPIQLYELKADPNLKQNPGYQ